MDYEWRLRLLMAHARMFKATDLTPRLAKHGIALSESLVWRLVTGKPERLNMALLVALCEILDCQPGDLIALTDATTHRKRASATKPAIKQGLEPRSVTLRRPGR